MIPVKGKSGPSVVSAFRSIFDDPKYSRRLWVSTDKGKLLVNGLFWTCYRTRGAFTFGCVGTQTRNVRSWEVCIAGFAMDSANICTIKIASYRAVCCLNM